MKKLPLRITILLILFAVILLFFIHPGSRNIIQLQLRPVPLIKKIMTKEVKSKNEASLKIHSRNKKK